jgi:hypothetical protein
MGRMASKMMATYAHYVNSGELLFTASGNNVGNHFNDVVAALHAVTGFEEVILTQTDNVVYTAWDGTLTSGTWNTTPPTGTIAFYAIKAGNGYAFYEVEPAEGTGSWSTFDTWKAGFNNGALLEISHFTGYNPGSAVPEPTTLLLLGSGLVGIVACRKKFKGS